MKNVQDILPLSPMQELMLLHLASATGGNNGNGSGAGGTNSEALLEQNVIELRGEVDPVAMRQAWQQEAARHAALRAAFVWQGLSKPAQVIHSEVTVPVLELDWRGETDAAQQEKLQALLAADRRQAFHPMRPPLFRVVLIRAGEDRWWMLFSAHHILIDRWSIGLLLRGVLVRHAALRQGRTPDLPRTGSYRDYLAYLAAQDSAALEHYWRVTLGDATRATRLPSAADGADAAEPPARVAFPDPAGRLRAFAQENRLTQSTVAQAALAVALAKLLQADDLVLGLTMSSRPADLPGVEGIVGMFSNNLPLRVRLPREQKVARWLQELQQQQTALQERASSPLPLVRECAAIPAHEPLFECLVVFQNDPAAELLSNDSELGLMVRGVGGHSRTSYPLTVMITPSTPMEAAFVYDPGRVDGRWVSRLADEMSRALQQLPDRAGATLAELIGPPSVAVSGADAFVAAAEESENFAAARAVAAPTPDAAVDVDDDAVAPSTPTERAIADVWRELLRLDRIGVNDNFFDIGGTSVLAVQASQRLKKRAGLQVNPMGMAVQTLAQLAADCASRKR